MKRFYVIIKGRVQGIGYRFFVQKEAEKRSLNGWVRNREDNTVDLEIDGEEKEIFEFLNAIKTQHSFAHITDIEYNEKAIVKPYAAFNISYY